MGGLQHVILKLLSIFKKVCAWWVPKMLMFNQKMYHVPVSSEHHQFELEGNTFLERIVTWNETWVQYFTPDSKWSNMEITRDLYHPKNSRQLSACKIMADVFLEFKRSDSYLFSSTCCNN
jgi:hypothetical protein